MKKIINIIFSFIFCLGLLALFATSNFKKSVVSDIDNRKLAEFPKVLFQPGFTSNVEAYLKDRIGGRTAMITGYQLLNYKVAHVLEHPSYALGEDGYVFLKMHDNVEYGSYHKTFVEMVAKIQQYCEERGTEFYLVFDPEKTSVCREHLPKGVNYEDEWVDELMAEMDAKGIRYVNYSEILKEKNQTEAVFNKVFDAGHWNDLGCFYATNELFKVMKEDHPEIPLLDKDMYNISTRTEKTLANSRFPVSEEVPSFELKTGYLDITDQWASEIEISQEHNHFHYYINQAEGSENLPKTLIFQGSYYNRRPQYLIKATSEDIGVHNYDNVMNFDYYYNIFQPDVVIFDVAEYVFSDKYFDSSKMKSMKLSPALFDYATSSIDEVLKDCEELPMKAGIEVFDGKQLSGVYVNIPVADFEYAYLVTDDMIFDLTQGEDNKYQLSCEQGSLNESKDVRIILKNQDGSYYCLNADVKCYVPLTDGYFEKLKLETEDPESVVNPGYIKKVKFVSSADGGKFNKVSIQLRNTEGKIICNIGRWSEPEAVNFKYIHENESGDYLIRLKANADHKDEYIDVTVTLTEGESYYFSFHLDSIEKQEVTIRDYKIFGRKPE